MKTPYFYGVCFSLAMFILINTTRSQVNLPDYLRQYYQYTDSAEMAIIDSSYAKASVYYVKAFEQNKKPFGIDIYNAGITEALQNKNKESYNYLEQVVAKGYGIDNIEQNDAFKTFITTEYGSKLKTFAKDYKPSYNVRYREILDSLTEVDQFDRINSYSGEKKKIKDSIDLRNVQYLEKLIQKYGFPSEFNVGLKNNSFKLLPGYIVMLHSMQHGSMGGFDKGYVDFKDYLNKALENGEITNFQGFIYIAYSNLAYFDNVNYNIAIESYALYKHYHDRKRRDFREMTEEEKNYLTEVGDSSILMTKWGYYKPDESNEEKINNIFKMYCVENLENLRKKVLFFRTENKFESKIEGAYNFMSWIYEEEYNEMIKDLISVE